MVLDHQIEMFSNSNQYNSSMKSRPISNISYNTNYNQQAEPTKNFLSLANDVENATGHERIASSSTILRNVSGCNSKMTALKSTSNFFTNNAEILSTQEINKKYEGLKEYLDANIYSTTTAQNSEDDPFMSRPRSQIVLKY